MKILTFHDTVREFELKRDHLKLITDKNYNVDVAKMSDKKSMYDFAKEMNFDLKATGNKTTRNRTLVKLLKTPGLMASALGVSKILVLSSNLNELSDRRKLFLQEKHAGNNSNENNDEISAIVDKLLEYKYISMKQHKQFLVKCNLIHE